MAEQRGGPPTDSPPKKSYITPGGYRALQAELERIWTVERPRITHEVEVAAAHGDRSENAEYIYGKKKLREIDRRLRYLRKRLEAVTVVESSPAQEGRVFFGAIVTVEDEDGHEATWQLVGPDELDVEAGRVSIEAPMALALIGKSEGDTVTVSRPKGRTQLTIVEIRYPHQSAR